jgi:hypothetical protein
MELMTMPEVSEILEETEIDGLHWEKNIYFDTGNGSRILIPSENGLLTTIVWHAPTNDKSWDYPHYALHLSGDDRLTYVNGKSIEGEFVDCRKGSRTFHKKIVLKWDGDPDRRLVVSAGIAHWLKNLSGVVTRNEPLLRWDAEPDPLYTKGADVFNILTTERIENFPSVRPHRNMIPLSWHSQVARQQRGWAKKIKYYPVRFSANGKIYTLFPKAAGEEYLKVYNQLVKAH